MPTVEMLRRFPYFADLDGETLKKLAAIAVRKTIGASTVMCDVGDAADALYIIVHGEVQISYPLANGDALEIQTLKDGDLLIWSSIVEPYRATSRSIAKRETILLAIDAKKLRELFETDPYLSYHLMHQVAIMLAQRLNNARTRFASLFGQLNEVLHPVEA